MKQNKNQIHHSWPWWRVVISGLSVLGLGLSCYLGWQHLTGGTVIGCGGGSSCDEVLSSRWASIGGVLPVSGLAAGVYLALLMASFYIGPTTEVSLRRMAWTAMLVLTGAAAGSAIWFMIVQKWIIGAFCPYCMVTHAIGLILLVLVVWRAFVSWEGNKESVSLSITRKLIGTSGRAFTGFALAGILAACQAFIVPKGVYIGGESSALGQPELELRAAPMVGSSDAPYVISLLFDYNCPHCQTIHFMLNAAVNHYDGTLAFKLCPTPLNSLCNPYIPRDVEAFETSCELAKISLAVWVAKPEVFKSFETWMFTFDSGDRWQPRSVDAAKAKAVELIGEDSFESALADPWIEQYLRSTIQIYGGTGNTAIPKLVYESRWVVPEPADFDDFISILQESLAIPAP